MLSLSGCSHHVTTQCLTNRVESDLKSGKPIVQVGQSYIYEGEIQALSEVMPGFRAGWEDPEKKRELIGQMIEQELFLQKAKEQNLLDKNERLQKNLWIQTRNYEAGTYLLQEVDKRAKDQYEKDKQRLYTQVEIRDIVYLFTNTGTEQPEDQKKIAVQKAFAVQKKLNSKNFSDIAAQETDNPIAKVNGGSIGAVSYIDERVRFMGWRALVEQAFRMKKGKVSNPIVTAEGVHIIQVVGDPQIQTYEAVLPYIRTQIEASTKKELMDQMLKEKPIKYLDPTLDPATATKKEEPKKN